MVAGCKKVILHGLIARHRDVTSTHLSDNPSMQVALPFPL